MDLIEIQKKIVPEMIDLIEKRYDILKYIYYNQPIGRRSLSNQLNMTERIIRTEINSLRDNNLLEIESMGMYVTDEGKIVIEELEEIMNEIKGISKLEKKLERLLKIEEVIIISNDSDMNSLVLKDMGKIASEYLREMIKSDDIIGITGGSTMESVANEMSGKAIKGNILVTPARGGLGEDLETQSNSIAANLAQKIGARYKLLHVPDNLDKDTLETVIQIPVIKDVIETIEKMDILLFGIGRADEMAERRNLIEKKIEELEDEGAVSEAFGHYFDIDGKEVWESPTVGMSIDTYKNIPKVIAVAGGNKKAEAIISISSLRKNITLITDEGAAREIIKLVE